MKLGSLYWPLVVRRVDVERAAFFRRGIGSVRVVNLTVLRGLARHAVGIDEAETLLSVLGPWL